MWQAAYAYHESEMIVLTGFDSFLAPHYTRMPGYQQGTVGNSVFWPVKRAIIRKCKKTVISCKSMKISVFSAFPTI